MNYETWMKHKDALLNKSWVPWGMWPSELKEALRSVDPEHRMGLDYEGKWNCLDYSGFHPGNIYRVNPAWPGPSKPIPVCEAGYEWVEEGDIVQDGDEYQMKGYWMPTDVAGIKCPAEYVYRRKIVKPIVNPICADGFRWVNAGETLLSSDQYLRNNSSWVSIAHSGSVVSERNAYVFRRAIPKVEYVDVPVRIFCNMYAYKASKGSDICVQLATSDTCFAGYVMPDGKLLPRLIFYQMPDSTYSLRVPKAVRLRKEKS